MRMLLLLSTFLGIAATLSPFTEIHHPLSISYYRPKETEPRAFPTGAWWTNLVLNDGDLPVVTMPYIAKVINHELHTCFPFRVVTPDVIQSGYASHIIFSTADAESSPQDHAVTNSDPMSVTVDFYDTTSNPVFQTYLVRGSPYMTVKYFNTVPHLSSGNGISISKIEETTKRWGRLVDGEPGFSSFAIRLSSGQNWALFSSDKDLKFSLEAGGLVANKPLTGVLRTAVATDLSIQLPTLVQHASVYPTGASLDMQKPPKDSIVDMLDLVVDWQTEAFGSVSQSLLMLALPHHSQILHVEEGSNELLLELQYASIRGMMTGVSGRRWRLRETLPDIDFDLGDDGLFASEETDPVLLKRREEAKEEIIKDLHADAVKYPNLPPDTYGFGKLISREARLALLADKFNQTELRQQLVRQMKEHLRPWLTSSNADTLLYDAKFGGVVPRDGVQNYAADFGAGYYNDHHFHFGYFTYAFAVLQHLDPAFIQTHLDAIMDIVNDIGSPLESTPAFPTARHKDFYTGHSYASGLFQMQVGKSQESSSESLNAYYSLALFHKDTKDEAHLDYLRYLVASEIRSTKLYWQMKQPEEKAITVYEPMFAENLMVGVVGDMTVVYSTWFGKRPVYVHGINMMPFTPISPLLLTEGYVAQEYPLLQSEYDSLESDSIWKSLLLLDYAILDANIAWDELHSDLNDFAMDTWNAMSYTKYWIATRPSWQRSIPTTALRATEQCFGYSECAAAGLWCCNTLPGCCPSTSLSCCPQDDTQIQPPIEEQCQGEGECAKGGFGCCSSVEGCCQPDPATNKTLDCCQHPEPLTAAPVTPVPAPTTPSSTPPMGGDYCEDQPKCQALGLDCCQTEGGCCNDDMWLGCCEEPVVATPKVDSCSSQPVCAAAGLECCNTPAGCCTPDLKTGDTLWCCQDPNGEVVPDTAKHQGEKIKSCQNEPACLQAGEGGNPLECCYTALGCCPGLLCCSNTEEEVDSGSGSESVAKGGWSAHEVIGLSILITVIVVVVVVLSVMRFRRRGYEPLGDGEEGDMRAWFCAGAALIVFAFFLYLVTTA